jgi:PAS domain S-box-containing protein
MLGRWQRRILPPDSDALPALRRMRYGYPFAILVLVVSVLFVLVAWDHARQRELRLASQQFRGIAGQQASLVQMHLNNIEVTLRGGASLFAAVDQPTPEQWRGYVDGLRVPSRFPYVLGLGYAVYVDGHGLTRLQEAWREQGRGLLEIRPRGHRERYGPILFLEPHSPGNRAALGFDMYAEATRRAAMRAAMESGRSQLSGRVVLVQDAAQPEYSLVLYMPVYAGLEATESPQLRRDSMRGWVYAPFRIGAMLRAALPPAQTRTRLRVVDTTDGGHVVMHQDAGIETTRHAFTHSLTMQFYGRRWRFDFFSGPTASAAPQLAALDKLLFAGLAASLLLFAMTWMLASTEARARRIAADMTQSYRRSEQRFRNAMQYSAIGKALLDSNGAIVESNPAFGRIFGRSDSTLRGHSLNEFLDEGATQPLVTSQMQAFDESGGVIRLTRTLRRGDGEVRHVQLTCARGCRTTPGSDVSAPGAGRGRQRTRARGAPAVQRAQPDAGGARRCSARASSARPTASWSRSPTACRTTCARRCARMEGFGRVLGGAPCGMGCDRRGGPRLPGARAQRGHCADGGADRRAAEAGADRARAAARGGGGRPQCGWPRRSRRSLARWRRRGAGSRWRIEPGLRARGDAHVGAATCSQNLLGNAWKFTRGPRGRARRVRARSGANAAADDEDTRGLRRCATTAPGSSRPTPTKLFKPVPAPAQPGRGIRRVTASGWRR